MVPLMGRSNMQTVKHGLLRWNLTIAIADEVSLFFNTGRFCKAAMPANVFLSDCSACLLVLITAHLHVCLTARKWRDGSRKNASVDTNVFFRLHSVFLLSVNSVLLEHYRRGKSQQTFLQLLLS